MTRAAWVGQHGARNITIAQEAKHRALDQLTTEELAQLRYKQIGFLFQDMPRAKRNNAAARKAEAIYRHTGVWTK